MTGSRISLPARFSKPGNMEKTLYELQTIDGMKVPSSWRTCGWISDEMFLFTDGDCRAILQNTEMKYDREKGLYVIE